MFTSGQRIKFSREFAPNYNLYGSQQGTVISTSKRQVVVQMDVMDKPLNLLFRCVEPA